jgi:hypothetical protein
MGKMANEVFVAGYDIEISHTFFCQHPDHGVIQGTVRRDGNGPTGMKADPFGNFHIFFLSLFSPSSPAFASPNFTMKGLYNS